MKALILAAGQGNRLGHHTTEKPKALVPVAGKELILHTLHFLKHPAIAAIGCVTGYQSEGLSSLLRELVPPVKVFRNTDYKAGNILTLQAALDFLDDDVLILNVDHIYPQKMLELIFKQVKGITAVCDFQRKLTTDDMKISRDKNRCLLAIDKKLILFDGGYIGMTICPAEKIPLYKESLEKTLQKRGRGACVEAILDELAKTGEPISIADTTPLQWLEIDTQEDLEFANQQFAILQKTGRPGDLLPQLR